MVVALLSFVAGIAALLLGSNLLVSKAVKISRFLGISPLLIGLTLVAVGMSLPELMVSTIAVFNGDTTENYQ